MDLIGYGEDALTLWAMTKRLEEILRSLGDSSEGAKCRVLFRPSFGRAGGDKSSQFGEFDFIILSETTLYLGESKWERSSDVKDEKVQLRAEQELRHVLFRFYVEKWSERDYTDWDEFFRTAAPKIKKVTYKPFVPADTLLEENLRTVLQMIQEHFKGVFGIINVLLYLYEGEESFREPQMDNEDFRLVSIDYSPDLLGNFIRL